MVDRSGKIGIVFFLSVIIVGLFVIWGFALPEHLGDTTSNALGFITDTFGWFYLFATFIFLIFSLYLAFGPYGKIKLGDKDDEPDYPYFTWLAMLFSAGMGIGLVFWGVAEPMFHYMDPPEGVTPGTTAAAEISLQYTFFHWGLHPWAIYAVVALALAYTQYRKKDTGLISSIFRPLFGNRVDGPLGKTIDILAAIATAAGVATSLGFGALQINGGLNYLTGLPNNTVTNLVIIFVVTVLFVLSSITGLNRGIKYLSNINLSVAAFLLLFVLLAGPTVFLINTFTTTLGSYIGNLVQMSFRLTPFGTGEWIGAWTLFYWAWWIAWAPFVGTFIARVSKGRTIKEFMITVLLVPTLLGGLWFAVFGGSGFFYEMIAGAGIAEVVSANMEAALFYTLDQLPLGTVLNILATLLILTFFITSADSATFVLGTLTAGGTLNPRMYIKLIWGVLIASIAAVLLFSGGLEGLQTASIIAALPFTVIMLCMIVSVNKSLKEELRRERRKEKIRLQKLEGLVHEELELGSRIEDHDRGR